MRLPFFKSICFSLCYCIFLSGTVFAVPPGPEGALLQSYKKEIPATTGEKQPQISYENLLHDSDNKQPQSQAQKQEDQMTKGFFENATYENFEEQTGFELFDESYLGSTAVTTEATANIDSGAVTKIQTTFLSNLYTAFSTVAKYALNLLYLFAVLEVVIFGFIWALRRDVGWDKLFFKVLKIGLIFFIIQNYTWLLDTIMRSFAQLAGVIINNATIAKYVFNPAKVWQYGYDAGINLLRLATATNNFGMAMVQISLGMGILLVFGLLGIQMILQIVGFYMVSLGALILLPFGAFSLGRSMLDRAVQAVLQAGIRLMTLIIIIGVAVVVWDGFQLVDLAKISNFSINQPLGLFFTTLLFLCLAFYLPKILSQVVGGFSGDFFEGGGATSVIVREPGVAPLMVTGETGDMRAATTIERAEATGGGYGGEIGGAVAIAPPVSVTVTTKGGGLEAKIAKETVAQASRLSKSVSETTVKKIKEAVLQAVKEKK